jgi:hypothetical protein
MWEEGIIEEIYFVGRWDEKAGARSMFQGVVSETSWSCDGGARAWPETAILPGVTALRGWTSLVVPAWSEPPVPHPDLRTKIRENQILQTKKSTSGLYVFVKQL